MEKAGKGKYKKSKESDKFWKLWPKDFHRPYGQGLEAPDYGQLLLVPRSRQGSVYLGGQVTREL